MLHRLLQAFPTILRELILAILPMSLLFLWQKGSPKVFIPLFSLRSNPDSFYINVSLLCLTRFHFWLLCFCSFPFWFPHCPLSIKTNIYIFAGQTSSLANIPYLGVLSSLLQIITIVSKLAHLQHALFSSNLFTTPELD